MSSPADTDIPDDVLMRRYTRKGDVAAMDVLVRRHSQMLLLFLRGWFTEPSEAEDAMHDVWLKVFSRPGAYRDDNFRGWLLRIARNLAIDRFRERKPDLSLDAPVGDLPDSDSAALVDLLPSSAPSPDVAAASNDALRVIHGEIQKLPPSQREVFLLRTVSDMSFKDIAKTLGIPLNTALGRMHYAVLRLREVLPNVL